MLHHQLELYFFLGLISCCCSVELFDFGTGAGDSQFPQGSSLGSIQFNLSLQSPIQHNGTAYNSVFVSS